MFLIREIIYDKSIGYYRDSKSKFENSWNGKC